MEILNHDFRQYLLFCGDELFWALITVVVVPRSRVLAVPCCRSIPAFWRTSILLVFCCSRFYEDSQNQETSARPTLCLVITFFTTLCLIIFINLLVPKYIEVLQSLVATSTSSCNCLIFPFTLKKNKSHFL